MFTQSKRLLLALGFLVQFNAVAMQKACPANPGQQQRPFPTLQEPADKATDRNKQDVSFFSKSYTWLKSSANSILHTVRSDLVLIPLEERNESKFLKAVRLSAYSIIFDTILLHCIKIPKGAKQFEKTPSFFNCLILGPIIEEAYFTWIPVNFFGAPATVVSPLLFGWFHTLSPSNNQVKLGCFLSTAFSNALRTRLYFYGRGEFPTCVMHHALRNFLSLLLNSLGI